MARDLSKGITFPLRIHSPAYSILFELPVRTATDFSRRFAELAVSLWSRIKFMLPRGVLGSS